eukprot:2838671-Prymnesium_polylepis.1
MSAASARGRFGGGAAWRYSERETSDDSPRSASKSSSSMKSSARCATFDERSPRDDRHSDGAHPSSVATVL